MEDVETTRSRVEDDILVVSITVLDLDEEKLTEPWVRFVARAITRCERRQRAEAVAERILALTLDLDR